jgi:cobalt-zinc-cadmium efflux system outer membrane protein
MRLIISLLIVLFSSLTGYSQIQQNALSLDEAEKLFLKNNLFLLAQQYNIGAKEALIIQAKSYPNPTFNADLNVYDPQHNKAFHVDTGGQKSFQVQQLILLGGKRKIEIDIAKQNKILAESEFAELLRNLKMQLNNSFFGLNEQLIIIQNHETQLKILDTIINAYEVQTAKGNLPLKDVIRLKSVYIKINNFKSELAAGGAEEQKKLQILLQTNQAIKPIINESDFQKFVELKPLSDLQALALTNRPDLKIADENALIAALNLKLQKRIAIPDVAVNGSYDQRGGAFRNQVNAGLTMPLPVWDRNRGNIKAASYDKQSMDLYVRQKKLEVELDIQQAWQNMFRSIAEYNKIKNLFNEEFKQVNKGENENFLKRNISILEFVDFVESYNESLADFERIKAQLAISAALINYVTSTKVY